MVPMPYAVTLQYQFMPMSFTSWKASLKCRAKNLFLWSKHHRVTHIYYWTCHVGLNRRDWQQISAILRRHVADKCHGPAHALYVVSFQKRGKHWFCPGVKLPVAWTRHGVPASSEWTLHNLEYPGISEEEEITIFGHEDNINKKEMSVCNYHAKSSNI